MKSNILFFISFFVIDFFAEVTNNSELFFPPNVQFVIFFAGNFILCIILAFLLNTVMRAPLK